MGSKYFPTFIIINDHNKDTINTASRMESNSKPGRIQLSRSSYERVYDLGYHFEERKIDVKGKGISQTYLLDNKHHETAVLTKEEMVQLMEEETKQVEHAEEDDNVVMERIESKSQVE